MLRLTVLIAERAQLLDPKTKACAEACRTPRASWKDRSAALRRLLLDAEGQSAPIATIVDVDALAPQEDADWDDLERQRVSRDFFNTVLDAVERRVLSVVRTTPHASVTRRLADIAMPQSVSPQNDESAEAAPFAAFAPDCRTFAQWLVTSQRLGLRDIREIVGTVRDFDDHVLHLAYEALSSSVRRSASVLSAERCASKKNGMFGHFAWSEQPTIEGVPRPDVDTLRAAGFLQADDAARPDELRMPRRARRLIDSYARATSPGLVSGVHKRLAAIGDFDKRPVEEQLEVHFHAVRARNVSLAKQTARCYGIELRLLATDLSREQHAYKDAAELFSYLIDNFDKSDPYVWEYWAFNLARWDAGEQASGRNEADIRKGYQEADRLAEQRNPLYRGRLLGYRAERGENIVAEFDRGMSTYLREYGEDNDAISRFVETVLNGVRRSGNDALRRSLVRNWRSVLERAAPHLLAKYGE
jgi:hypothetical protein